MENYLIGISYVGEDDDYVEESECEGNIRDVLEMCLVLVEELGSIEVWERYNGSIKDLSDEEIKKRIEKNENVVKYVKNKSGENIIKFNY